METNQENDVELKYLSLIDKRIELFEKIISKLTAKQGRKLSNHNFAMITKIKKLKEEYSDKKKQINSLLKSEQSNGALFEQKNQSTENKIKGLFKGELAELKEIKSVIINNGIQLDLFPQKFEKLTNTFIYTSGSFRGLKRLLELWPSILIKLPNAKLNICEHEKSNHDLSYSESLR